MGAGGRNPGEKAGRAMGREVEEWVGCRISERCEAPEEKTIFSSIKLMINY